MIWLFVIWLKVDQYGDLIIGYLYYQYVWFNHKITSLFLLLLVETVLPKDLAGKFHQFRRENPLVMTNSLLWKMAIEIVNFPINNADFPWLCKRLSEGNY